MSSTQQAATITAPFQLPTAITPPQTPAALVVKDDTPKVPKDTLGQKVGRRWKAIGDSTHVEAAKLWFGGVGAVAGYALPAAAFVEGARLASQVNGGAPSHVFFATCAGAVAAIASAAFQGSEGGKSIKLYKQEGYKLPRLVSFVEVSALTVAPALAGAYYGGAHYGPWWGNAIGCAAALVGSSMALVHLHVREKRVRGTK